MTVPRSTAPLSRLLTSRPPRGAAPPSADGAALSPGGRGHKRSPPPRAAQHLLDRDARLEHPQRRGVRHRAVGADDGQRAGVARHARRAPGRGGHNPRDGIHEGAPRSSLPPGAQARLFANIAPEPNFKTHPGGRRGADERPVGHLHLRPVAGSRGDLQHREARREVSPQRPRLRACARRTAPAPPPALTHRLSPPRSRASVPLLARRPQPSSTAYRASRGRPRTWTASRPSATTSSRCPSACRTGRWPGRSSSPG